MQKYSERLIYFCHKIIVADVVGSFAPLNMMHLKCAIRQGRYSVAQKIGREESKRPFLQDRGQFVLVNYTSWHVYCVIADVLFPLGLHSRRSIFSPFALLTFFLYGFVLLVGARVSSPDLSQPPVNLNLAANLASLCDKERGGRLGRTATGLVINSVENHLSVRERETVTVLFPATDIS